MQYAINITFNYFSVNKHHIFIFQVDNFVDCEDDDDYDDKQEAPEILDPLLEDEFLSSQTYCPSVPSTSSTSKNTEIKSKLKLQGPGNLKDVSDDDCRETREICYLPGN